MISGIGLMTELGKRMVFSFEAIFPLYLHSLNSLLLNLSGYNIMSLFPVTFKVSPWSCNWWDCLSWVDFDSRHLMVVGISNTVNVCCRML